MESSQEAKESLFERVMFWLFVPSLLAMLASIASGIVELIKRAWGWGWNGIWVIKPMSDYWPLPSAWAHNRLFIWLWSLDQIWWMIFVVPFAGLTVVTLIDEILKAPDRKTEPVAETMPENLDKPAPEGFGALIRRLTLGWFWPRTRGTELNVLGRFGRVIHWAALGLAGTIVGIFILVCIFSGLPDDPSAFVLVPISAFLIAMLGRAGLYIFANE